MITMKSHIFVYSVDLSCWPLPFPRLLINTKATLWLSSFTVNQTLLIINALRCHGNEHSLKKENKLCGVLWKLLNFLCSSFLLTTTRLTEMNTKRLGVRQGARKVCIITQHFFFEEEEKLIIEIIYLLQFAFSLQSFERKI